MASFRLFPKLPLDLQLEVLRKLDLVDLVSYSFICAETKDLVKTLNRKIDLVKWEFESDGGISIDLDLKFGLEIARRRCCFDPEHGELDVVELNGISHLFHHQCPHFWTVVGKKKDYNLELLDQWSEHLCSIFNVQDFLFESHADLDYTNLFVWKHTKHFKAFRIDADVLSDDELKFILEELTYEHFSLPEHFTGDMKYSGPLNMKSFHTDKTNWLTLDAVLGMSCREFSISGNLFSLSNVNVLVKAWISGKCLQNLELLQIGPFCDTSYQELLEEALEGIESFPCEKDDNPLPYNLPRHTNIRRVDGTLATFFSVPGIFMMVWKSEW